MKNLVLATVGCMLLFAGCAKPSSDLVIDLRLDMANTQDSYLNWMYDEVETKDSFDAASGASVAQSSAGLNVAFLDSTETSKFTLPIGLRSLVLFSIASEALLMNDAFVVTGSGGNFVIQFVHRADAYQIIAVNGKLDLTTSFKMAVGVCDYADGNFTIKDRFLAAGGDASQMKDLDWTKIPLVADMAAVDASRSFSGDLGALFSNNVLTAKGTLTQKIK